MHKGNDEQISELCHLHTWELTALKFIDSSDIAEKSHEARLLTSDHYIFKLFYDKHANKQTKDENSGLI